MTQTVILGIKGEDGLWLVDLRSGTVTAVTDSLSGELGKAASLRSSDVTVTKGIDFAITASAETLVASGIHEGND